MHVQAGHHREFQREEAGAGAGLRGRRDDPPGGRHPEGGPQTEEGGPRPLLNLSQITRCINITTTPVSEQTN